MSKLPAEEDNSGSNQNNDQQQNQTTTKSFSIYVVEENTNSETKIGSATIQIGTLEPQTTGVGGGKADFSNVPEGTYNIVVTATGYNNYESSSFVVSADMDSTIYIELSKS